MNQALKQRLVGAVVLVALAVIFLPAVFNGGRHARVEAFKEVPPAPAVAALVIEAPKRPQNNAGDQVTPASEMYSMEPKPLSTVEKIQSVTKTTAVVGKPELNSKQHPNAWVLQVGVFSDKAKAEALKKTLLAKGYRAFTRSVAHDKNSPDKKAVTRVMIGPEFEQSAISKLKLTVDKEFSVKSIVVKFEP